MKREDISAPLLPATGTGRHLLQYFVIVIQYSGGEHGSSYFTVQCVIVGHICDSWVRTRLGGVCFQF